MSRSCESAMPIALRYSSLERKCVYRARARSAGALGAAGTVDGAVASRTVT